MATREGVEKLPLSRRNQAATRKQKERIEDIISSFPDSIRLFEYEDYQDKPTLENASAFITAAIDHNLDKIAHQEVYVNYIATRPRAEKLGTHGLFSDGDEPLVLSQVADEVAKHIGNIWTPIISLRREDAARLGHDNADAWIALLRKQRNVFAEHMKIEPANLRWYAAFHNEGHHPHCHMVIYSVNPREGYVSKTAIEKMRSSLARDIFQQDLIQMYSEQTTQRNTLAEQSRSALQRILEQMKSGTCNNTVIENLLSQLAEKLRHTSGKKQYGYLKAPLKELVNQIVDELAKDTRVTEAYHKWQVLRNEILHTYKDHLPDPLPLSQQKELKQIKNIVISEAMNIGTQHFTIEEDETKVVFEEERIPEVEKASFPLPDEKQISFLNEPEDEDDEPPASGSVRTDLNDSSEDNKGESHIAWSDRYKEARAFLYGTDDMEPDFEQALRLFTEEADNGNALAMHDLGRMYADGLGMEIDREISFAWYNKALSAFFDVEGEKENRYVEYRIGKMYASGLGTEQDYEEAAAWFEAAVSKKHKYAQYSLAGMYYRGQGVEQSFETAFELYGRSANQRVPYASYELAKMYRDGIGTEKNVQKAELHFEEAFYGFQRLEEKSHDDKLQYRLGHMLYTGTGTVKDIAAAVGYFEKAARLGNVHAQYMLGKIYLETEGGHENIEKAIQWLNKAAEGGNSLAQYALGKLYRDGGHLEKDMEKAIILFTQAAEQNNEFAAYALGKLYLTGEDVPKDVEMAVKWLTLSVEIGNQYAENTLAKLYLKGEDVPKDTAKAVELFTKSALQNNPFAQYQLGRIYLSGEHVPKNVEAAVKWLTASAEQGNQYAQYHLGKLYLLGEDVSKDIEAAVKWLTASGKQGDQYAQYALGKLFLMGWDTPRDREVAVRWLTMSAEQGNIYAQFLLDHLDSFRDPSLFLAATRLLHHLSRIFQEDQRRFPKEPGMQAESKLRRRLHQKKIAMGHAADDHELKQTT